MADDSVHTPPADRPSEPATTEPGSATDRRGFMSDLSAAAMAGGLVVSYGTLATMAGRYLFPRQQELSWLFVADLASIKPGDSLSFESPGGVRAVITRQPGARQGKLATKDDFIALSSVCPHLGCRVHWEAVNERFFCPCHNGSFDPQGNATGGPPKAAGQNLPRYALRVDNGLLFIQMPIETVGRSNDRLGPAGRSEREA